MSSETSNLDPSCRRIAPLLDDSVDGLLSRARQLEVDEHLADCADCSARLRELETLCAAVDALPRAVEPPADLWPLIAPRLAARPAAPTSAADWRLWARQAAAALIFMALGALLSQILLPGWKRGPVGSAVDLADVDQADVDLEGVDPADAGRAERAAGVERRADFALAEANYLRAKESLWSAVHASRPAASPETREVVERNLRVIDRAIRELREALQDDPGNPQLENLLLTQHRTEIDLLQRLALATFEI